MKLRKIITIGLATMMAISTMGISALAAEKGDTLLATIPKKDGEVVEVYKNDVVKGGYIVDCGLYTITIDGDSADIPFLAKAIGTGTFKTQMPSGSKAVSGTSNWNLTFSNTLSQIKYTPYQYTPALGYSSITYHFTSNANYGTKVYATVNCINNPAYSPVTLYFADGNEHSVSISGMIPGNCCYAYVTNSSYSGTATGTCRVSN